MKKSFFALFAILCVGSSQTALAHSALMNCFDNGDSTFTCQGGFSDGSSAAGIEITVRDSSGNVLQKAKMVSVPVNTYLDEASGGDSMVA